MFSFLSLIYRTQGMNPQVWCKLPEELLDAVIETAAAQSQTDAAVLVRCSSQWQRRIQPRLYLNPSLAADRIERFYETVTANSALRLFPRSLQLSPPLLSATQIDALSNILKLCKNVKRLCVSAALICPLWSSLTEALLRLDIISESGRIWYHNGLPGNTLGEARHIWFTRQNPLMSDCLLPNHIIPQFLALPIDARKDCTNFHRLMVDCPSKLGSQHTVVLNIVYPPVERDVYCQIVFERALRRLSDSPFCLIVRYSIDDETIWEPLPVNDPRSLWRWAASEGKIYGRRPIWD